MGYTKGRLACIGCQSFQKDDKGPWHPSMQHPWHPSVQSHREVILLCTEAQKDALAVRLYNGTFFGRFFRFSTAKGARLGFFFLRTGLRN